MDENKIKCKYCGYEWNSKSQMFWICCPRCQRKGKQEGREQEIKDEVKDEN